MSTRAASGPVRADLQGLRAVAVALVVVFHLSPTLVPGGFIGVDVFFAISGFLITAHLLRELDESGTIRLGRFWARRARRLLPAALTVLLATLLGCWALAPMGDLPRFLREIAWSALYVENWALAGSSVDYLAAESSPSPVQHYWSLSVEEQFYLIWPVLLLGTIWATARVRSRIAGRRSSATRPAPRTQPGRIAIAVVLGSVLSASLLWSLVYTAADPAPAYFATTTRAWEFAAGGLLAVVLATRARRPAVPDRVRTAAAWAGLAAVGIPAFAYSGATPFPSVTATVPVLGTLAVVWAAAPVGRSTPLVLLGLRPVQWLGDRSYAVYLWHWPVLVLGGFLLARTATVPEQLGFLALTLVLAEVTTRWIERPIRFGAPAAWRPSRILGATAGAMVVVLAISASTLSPAEARIVDEQRRIEALVAAPPPCFGAAALLDAARCAAPGAEGAADGPAPPGPSGGVVGSPVSGRAGTSADPITPDPSLADAPPERCITDIRASTFTVCAYGAPAAAATRTVALIGDSHAEQWLPAFAAAADAGGWRLLVAAKSSCPFTGAQRTESSLSADVLAEMRAGCSTWNQDALQMLSEQPEIDTIVVSARARNPVVATDGRRWQDTAAEAYAERWARVPATVAHIVVLRDTPTMATDVLDCVRDHTDPERACARDRPDALVEDPQYDAALASTDPRVTPVDLTDALCTAERCSPVIGDVLTYRDSHHLSWVYAATLAPLVRSLVDGLPRSRSLAGD